MYSIEGLLTFIFLKRIVCRVVFMEITEENRKSFRSFRVVFARNAQHTRNVCQRFEKIIFLGLNAKCAPVFIIYEQHISRD